MRQSQICLFARQITYKLTQSEKQVRETIEKVLPRATAAMDKGTELAILIVAAGRGSRAGSGLPKQYRNIAGRPLLAHTIGAMARAAPQAHILCVIHPDDIELYTQAIDYLGANERLNLTAPAFGGATRQASVFAGLMAFYASHSQPKIVLIQDAARLFSSYRLVEEAISAARLHGAAVPGILVSDTIKQVDIGNKVVATPNREFLRAVQTPQAFAFELIFKAHRDAQAAGAEGLTDDGAIAEWAGHKVEIFPGDSDNMKVTNAADFVAAEARLMRDLTDIRIGQGYDVHALGDGSGVWLGGVNIPHTQGLIGHSDADVLTHAITDALFGALAEGDIGSHFPPSDPQWKGAASSIFLAEAVRCVRARGGMIANIDATVICERPKIGPHRDAIRQSLASIIGVSLDRVAVKATTTERLGFTGREEGIAATAIATIRLPL